MILSFLVSSYEMNELNLEFHQAFIKANNVDD